MLEVQQNVNNVLNLNEKAVVMKNPENKLCFEMTNNETVPHPGLMGWGGVTSSLGGTEDSCRAAECHTNSLF